MQKRTITEEDLLAAKKLKQIWDEKKKPLGLTQEKAADLLGFATQASISHYLTGKQALGVEAVLKFASLLQVAPEEIRPDMSELFAPVRRFAATTEIASHSPPKSKLTEKELLLLELYNELPDSEAEKIINLMKSKKNYFEKIMKELVAKKAAKNRA